MPGLVPAAAEGLIVVTVCATVLHVMAAEYSSAAITFVLVADGESVGARPLAAPPRG
jgi:hypothetical protein